MEEKTCHQGALQQERNPRVIATPTQVTLLTVLASNMVVLGQGPAMATARGRNIRLAQRRVRVMASRLGVRNAWDRGLLSFVVAID